MGLYLEDIIADISSGCHTEIYIWDKLKDYFSEYWDGEKNCFERVVNLSRDKLGPGSHAIDNTAKYFEILENNFSDKNDLLDFLINLTGYMNYHAEDGSVNVEKKLKELRNDFSRVRQKCMKKGIFRDKYFVGRHVEIQKITDEIKSGNKRGILVYGMGGMGKTSLTRTVCYELRHENWKTVRIELREQRTFSHFLKSTVYSIKELRGSYSSQVKTITSERDIQNENGFKEEENSLQHIFFDYVKSRSKRKFIFLFDNIDDIEDSSGQAKEKQKVVQFLLTFLNHLSTDSQVRIIVTDRDDFLASNGTPLDSLMLKIEVKRLTTEDAIQLVRTCTVNTNLQRRQMETVVNACGACPLAIRVTCDSINDTFHFNQEIYLPGCMPSSLEHIMNNCLNKPYQNLDEEEQKTLCKLSLFGTSKFDLKSADAIVNGVFTSENYSKKEELERLDTLLKLKFSKLFVFRRRHLLEIDNEFEEVDENRTTENDESVLNVEAQIYSFHPLVEKFLTEKASAKNMKENMKDATIRYMAYFDNIVSSIGKYYDFDPLKAREEAEKIRPKARKYMQLMESHGDIARVQSTHEPVSLDDIKGRNNVFYLISDEEHHLWFMKRVRDKCEPRTLAKCAWDIEYVSAVINHERWYDGLEEKCEEINQFLTTVEEKNIDKTEKLQVQIFRGRMQYNEGLMKMDGLPRESLKAFERAQAIFETRGMSSIQQVKIYLGDIFNCLGCLKYRNEEPDIALQYHRQAISTLKVICEQHEHILTSLANIGACHYKLGTKYLRDVDTNEKGTTELRKCVSCYTNCIDLAVVLKVDKTDKFVKFLKNRADAHTMLNQFEEAESDFLKCLYITRELHQSPSRNEIVMLNAHCELIYKRIIERKRKTPLGAGNTHRDVEDSDTYMDMIEMGIEISDKIKSLLTPKIFPKDDPLFTKIRKNHLFFLYSNKEVERHDEMRAFYSSYHHIENDDNVSSPASSNTSVDSEIGSLDQEYNSDISENADDTNYDMSSKFTNETPTHSRDIDKCLAVEAIDKQNCFKSPLPKALSEQYRSRDDSSKSSSGVSSLGSITSECVNGGKGWITSRESSVDDDVFCMEQSNCSEHKAANKTRMNLRRPTLWSFGSGSVDDISEEGTTYDGEERKRRAAAERQHQPLLKRQRSESWLLTDKLTSRFEDNEMTESGTQTELKSFDCLLDELQQHIPIAQPRLKTLIKSLESGHVTLVDDKTGRPKLHYNDEDA